MSFWALLLHVKEQMKEHQLSSKRMTRIFLQSFLLPICLLMPSLILSAIFLAKKGMTKAAGVSNASIGSLLSLYSLVSFDMREQWLSTTLAFLFVVMILYLLLFRVTLRQMRFQDGFLFVGISYIFIYFIAPARIGEGGFLNSRLILYIFFAFILWFGTFSYLKMVKRGLVIAVIIISLCFLGIHAAKYAELQDYFDEYFSGMDLVEPNRTLLPLSFSYWGRDEKGNPLSYRIAPFMHSSGYLAAQRDILEFDNYEANTRLFPLTFRMERSPVYIGSLNAESPTVDILNYSKRTGGSIDYILLWDAENLDKSSALAISLEKQLQTGYGLIHTSSPRGLMKLYRRKES
jgi:hypothetical protein